MSSVKLLINGIFFVLAFPAGILTLNAQKIINYTAQWNELNIVDAFFGTYTALTYEYRFLDSISIDNEIYHNLYYNTPEITEWVLWGSFKEEDNKLFRYDSFENKPVLIYDFNIDSLGQLIYLYRIQLEVVKIDSINLSNGENRISYHLIEPDNFNSDTVRWIKGIGGTHCPFNPSNLNQEDVDGSDCFLQCYFVNETDVLYSRYGPDSCYTDIVSSTIQNDTESKIIIFPNPSIDKIQLQSKENFNLEDIRIVDISGRLMPNPRFNNNAEITNQQSYPPGIYFICFEINTRLVIKKWVKLN